MGTTDKVMTGIMLVMLIGLVPTMIHRVYYMGIIGCLVFWRFPQVPTATDIVCCEHNPCPQLPKPKAQYKTQPWRCPECKGWWITKHKTSWATMEEGGYWEWKKVVEAVGDTFIQELT